MNSRPMPCSQQELGSLFLFEELAPDQLALLCREGRVEEFAPGLRFDSGPGDTRFRVRLPLAPTDPRPPQEAS
ncbi:hypothetical protein [Streptomyces platensis]|uniref:hypothetical protein n=1 Tax=Streptomyces platensis TaxID=58346 RepID=UPI00386F0919|nr:hypothetical protein OG962_28745 [Streptomyces platensis]